MSLSRWRGQYARFRERLGSKVDDEDLVFSAFLAEKRWRLLHSARYGSSPSNRALGRRLAARYRTKIIRDVSVGGERRRVVQAPELLLYRVRDDHLRDRLAPGFRTRWRSIAQRLKDRRKGHVQLRDFSFSRNPRGTLRQIRDVVRSASEFVDVRLDFMDKRCDDVAPYIVLSHIMRSLPPVFSGGKISTEVAAVLESVGLDNSLGIRGYSSYRHRDRLILPFRMVHRAPPGFFGDKDHQLRPQYKELVADRFCNALGEWLELYDFELTPEGEESLVNSITEALDNAERHGCPDVDGGMGDWSMAGFSRLVETGDGDFRLECSVSIVSVGATISESLDTAAPDIREKIDRYVRRHSSATGTNRQGLLRTVMAVQDGVTRVSEASSDRRGGVGLMTLVNLFGALGDTDNPALQSVFTVLSGKSCLRVTAPYRQGTAGENSTLRELWFNEENCANEAPSASHAFEIGDEFAGTVLSACFTIDPEYLSRKFAA